MTSAELYEAAWRMVRRPAGSGAKEMRDNIKGLAADPRFAAVLALVLRQREYFVATLGTEAMADHHGALAHCAGKIRALEIFEKQLVECLLPKAASGPRQVQSEE